MFGALFTRWGTGTAIATVAASAACAGLLGGCTASAPEAPGAPEGIRVESVELWRHEGPRPVVRAESRTLRLDPELTEARMGDARLELLSEGLVAEAPTARMDLEGRRVTGEGGIRVRSGAAALTGPTFELDLEGERLVLPDGVRADAEVAR